jgi:hypothetical protein
LFGGERKYELFFGLEVKKKWRDEVVKETRKNRAFRLPSAWPSAI